MLIIVRKVVNEKRSSRRGLNVINAQNWYNS
jgi:hypothetical protein